MISKDTEVYYTYDYEEEQSNDFISIFFYKAKRYFHKLIKAPNRAYFFIDGEKIDVFAAKEQEFSIGEFSVGRQFKISHPKYSIEAKERYMKDLLTVKEKNKGWTSKQEQSFLKHQKDYIEYQKWEKRRVAII
jgi:hypothetical protein